MVPGGWETQDEIAEAVNMTQQAIDKRLKELQLLENFPKVVKLSALYQDDFEIPIFLPILQSIPDQSVTTA